MVARVGMTGVTLFGLALVATVSPIASVVVTELLLAWYAALAAEARLPRWWGAMVGIGGGASLPRADE